MPLAEFVVHCFVVWYVDGGVNGVDFNFLLSDHIDFVHDEACVFRRSSSLIQLWADLL